MSKYRTKKRFGQHFLHDPIVIHKIIAALSPQLEDCLVEIGPGLGALSVPLLQYVHRLSVVEVDDDVLRHLRQHQPNSESLTIYHSDALRFDFTQIISDFSLKVGKKTDRMRIVGNLPYNISTPLLFHLLGFREYIHDMHFMLQKEVVERMVAQPGSKDYGRLSVMTQYFCHSEYLFHVGKGAFNPPPKVESAVVRLVPWCRLAEDVPYQANDEQHFAAIVRQAFSQRRKTLSNSLKRLLSREHIIASGLAPNIRAEQLSVADFVKLANRTAV